MISPGSRQGQRLVHRDSYIEVSRAYYQVPPEYIGRRLWVRWDGRMVRIFDDKMQPVVKHVRLEAGKSKAKSVAQTSKSS